MPGAAVLIVDTTFFFGELEIPQVTEAYVQSYVTSLIQEHEPRFLEQLFGYAMYKDYLANQAASKYQDIINGKEYTDAAGVLRKWKGLKYATLAGPPPAKFKSAIANYIYFRYMQDSQTASTGTGEKGIEANSTIVASPWSKMVRSWNSMVDDNIALYNFISVYPDVYPLYIFGYLSGLYRKLNMLF